VDELDMHGKPVRNDGPSGIGGWLILPLIGLIGTLVLTGVNLVMGLQEITPDLLREVMAAETPEMEKVRLAFLLSLLGGFTIIGTASSALYQFLRKRRSLPGAMVVHYLAAIAALGCEVYAANLLDSLMPGAGEVSEAWKWMIRGVIGGALWIAYFRMSVRVKNTFVT
jgi:hypothetical protein